VKRNTEISVSCYRLVCCQNNIQRERERERERERQTDRQTDRRTEGQKERNRRGDVICFTPTRRSDVRVSSVASPFSDRSAHFQSGLSTPIIHGLLRIDNEPKRKSVATFKCRLAVRNLIAICSLVEPAEVSRCSD